MELRSIKQNLIDTLHKNFIEYQKRADFEQEKMRAIIGLDLSDANYVIRLEEGSDTEVTYLKHPLILELKGSLDDVLNKLESQPGFYSFTEPIIKKVEVVLLNSIVLEIPHEQWKPLLKSEN